MVTAMALMVVRAVTLTVAAGVEDCSTSNAACRFEASSQPVLVLIFGYWIPEVITPLLALYLLSFAAKLRRKRQGLDSQSRVFDTSPNFNGSSADRTSRQAAPSRQSLHPPQVRQSLTSQLRARGSAKVAFALGASVKLAAGKGAHAKAVQSDEGVQLQGVAWTKPAAAGGPHVTHPSPSPSPHPDPTSNPDPAGEARITSDEGEGGLDDGDRAVDSRERRGTGRLLSGCESESESGPHASQQVRASQPLSAQRVGSSFESPGIKSSAPHKGLGAKMGSFSALGTFKNLLQRARADRTYECSFQYSVPLLTEPVEVCETMEESNFIWQVAKAYLPLVQAHTRKQIELLKESLLAEGVREGRTMDEMRAFAQGYDATPTDAPDSRTRALTRLEDGDDDIEASGGSAWSHTYTCSCVHGPTQTVAAVLTELLFDVSAGLECSRLHWLSVLHQKYSAQLSSLQEPIAVSFDRQPVHIKHTYSPI